MSPQKVKQWPVPYCGPMVERVKRLGAPHETSTCAGDRTGKIHYVFNSLGYRGDEFRPQARLRIFSFGESDAFGNGIEHEHAWPTRVATSIGECLGLAEHEVCYLNFAEPGGSCDLIARQVITQCSAAPPDLVLINFAECMRTEGFVRGQAFNIGHWIMDPEFRKPLEAMPRSELDKHPYEEAMHRGEAYVKFSSSEHGSLAAVRSMLLTQHFLAATGTLAFATTRPQWSPFQQGLQDNQVIGPLLAQIDPEFLVPHEHGRPTIDTGAHGNHHGPRGNAAIAAFVVKRLESNGTVAALRKRLQATAQDHP